MLTAPAHPQHTHSLAQPSPPSHPRAVRTFTIAGEALERRGGQDTEVCQCPSCVPARTSTPFLNPKPHAWQLWDFILPLLTCRPRGAERAVWAGQGQRKDHVQQLSQCAQPLRMPSTGPSSPQLQPVAKPQSFLGGAPPALFPRKSPACSAVGSCGECLQALARLEAFFSNYILWPLQPKHSVGCCFSSTMLGPTVGLAYTLPHTADIVCTLFSGSRIDTW